MEIIISVTIKITATTTTTTILKAKIKMEKMGGRVKGRRRKGVRDRMSHIFVMYLMSCSTCSG